MYNLNEYSKNYLPTSGILWQYHRDQPALTLFFLGVIKSTPHTPCPRKKFNRKNFYHCIKLVYIFSDNFKPITLFLLE